MDGPAVSPFYIVKFSVPERIKADRHMQSAAKNMALTIRSGIVIKLKQLDDYSHKI